MRRLALLLVAALLPALALAEPVASKAVTIVGWGGVSLKGAIIRVEKLDGTSMSVTLDPQGKAVVREVPLGILKVTIVSWKGVPVDYTVTVTPSNATVVCPKIGKLFVTVKGAAGQPIKGAEVKVLYEGKLVEAGTTDKGGSFTIYLPEAEYTVIAEYAGRRVSTAVKVPGSGTGKASLSIDVFMVVGGLPLTYTEVVEILIGLAVAVIVLFVIAYEYSAWRRKRLVKKVVARA